MFEDGGEERNKDKDKNVVLVENDSPRHSDLNSIILQKNQSISTQNHPEGVLVEAFNA